MKDYLKHVPRASSNSKLCTVSSMNQSSKSVLLLLSGGATKGRGRGGGVSPEEMRKKNKISTKAGVAVQGWGECF